MKTSGNEFQRMKLAYEKGAGRRSGLNCSTSTYEGCPQICLRKDSWGRGKVGMTFHVWLDKDAAARNKIRYNIHALKMRQLQGYVITSRDFADDFRKHFKGFSKDWPNVRVDYGPLNLMEGWFNLHPESFERDVLALMDQFGEISPIIDRLLEERTAPLSFRR